MGRAEEMRDYWRCSWRQLVTETGALTGSCDAAEVASSLAASLGASNPQKAVIVLGNPGVTAQDWMWDLYLVIRARSGLPPEAAAGVTRGELQGRPLFRRRGGAG